MQSIKIYKLILDYFVFSLINLESFIKIRGDIIKILAIILILLGIILFFIIFFKKGSSKKHNETNLEENSINQHISDYDETIKDEEEDETISAVFSNKSSIYAMFGLFLLFITIILYIFFKINNLGGSI